MCYKNTLRFWNFKFLTLALWVTALSLRCFILLNPEWMHSLGCQARTISGHCSSSLYSSNKLSFGLCDSSCLLWMSWYESRIKTSSNISKVGLCKASLCDHYFKSWILPRPVWTVTNSPYIITLNTFGFFCILFFLPQMGENSFKTVFICLTFTESISNIIIFYQVN